ncbi:MAG: DNA polymerase/3'-5' exonuclease PolX [Syntrophales bacterium]|nr:DNA polymerase/3'-5' exonuclease PolX [Syntrophales bacterium]
MDKTVTKKDVIAILEDIGKLLELKGETPFKSRAYYSAARNIAVTEEDINVLVSEKNLTSIKGIGDALNQKITELVTTGALEYYEKLKSSIPPGHIEMLRIEGLGPKKTRALYEKLHIETIGELEYACTENRLVELTGFGKKTQDKILIGIERLKRYQERRLYADIIGEAESIIDSILKHKDVISASLAGSIRRCNEVIKDIDIVASAKDPRNFADFFVSLPEVRDITARGETRVSVVLESGVNGDLRIVSEEAFPYALHHFTGSKEHNIAMRGKAKRMGIKMNEYGLFRENSIIPCESEKQIFAALGLSFIPPELRENMGEIEAAESGELPDLVERKDIRGLLHIHTSASDGSDSLEAIVDAAKKMGMEYIGVADHSQYAYYAGGISADEIKRQHGIIDEINGREEGFHIFKGIEADILPDGSLDYDEDILRSFDFVIAAVHSNFRMSEEEMNSRLTRALENKYTTILAHPTGRLLLAREPYSVDVEKIIDAAARLGKVIELNANPYRLDLDWRYCRYATKQGVKIAINPDAHNTETLRHVDFGINIARKGWLEPTDCINCLSLEEMKEFLYAHRP